MWDVDRPQRSKARQRGDGNMHSHSQRRGIEGQAPPDFTTVVFDPLEVTEALQRRTLRVVRLHSLLNVSSGPHFNMEAQFSFNLAGTFIRTPARVNDPGRGF